MNTYEFKKGVYGSNNHECYWIYFNSESLNKYVLTEDITATVSKYLDLGYQILFTI